MNIINIFMDIYTIGVCLFSLGYIIKNYSIMDNEGRKGFDKYFIAYLIMLVYFFYKLTNDLFVTQIDLRSCMP